MLSSDHYCIYFLSEIFSGKQDSSLTLALGMNMFSVSMCLTRVSVMSLTLGVYAISFMSRLSAIPKAARLEEEEPATATA